MQSHHRGALVVQAATAHEVAVLLGYLEGLEGPPGTGGHHVHVPDDAQLLFGLAGQVGEADVALAVGGGHAHALGDLERRGQGGSGARPIGRPGLGRGQVLGRGNFHEFGDVRHNGVAVGVPVGAGRGNDFLAIHVVVLSNESSPEVRAS